MLERAVAQDTEHAADRRVLHVEAGDAAEDTAVALRLAIDEPIVARIIDEAPAAEPISGVRLVFVLGGRHEAETGDRLTALHARALLLLRRALDRVNHGMGIVHRDVAFDHDLILE